MAMHSQPFKTFEEQIEVLRKRGLFFSDEEKAKEILARENYYNVINGYKYLFIAHDSIDERYIENCTFEEIYCLYDFDKNLRNIIFKAILQIENELKTQISYVFSEYHQETNYLCYDNFETLKHIKNSNVISKRASKIYSLLSKIQNDISRSIRYKDYINHNIIKHGYIPLWVLVNALPLNRISEFYKIMNQSERIKVSMHWNINEKSLRQHIDLLAHFRNLCAHDERVYCSKSEVRLADSFIHKAMQIEKRADGTFIFGKNDFFSLLITFKLLLNHDDFISVYNKICESINTLYSKLNCIRLDDVLSEMGFPENWQSIKNL